MNIVTLDIESYYKSGEFSLKGLSTQEYISSEQWQTIGVGVQWAPYAEPFWATHAALDQVMATLRNQQDRTIIVAHNALFDASILAWHYGVRPAMVVDTLSMARSLGLQATVGGSLSKLADLARKAGLNIPVKGDEVVRADGKRLEDFTPAELAAYGRYCNDDVRICSALYQEFSKLIPFEELIWQSKVLKMYTEPMLSVNGDVVDAELLRVRQRRAAASQRLADALGFQDQAAMLSIINSNQKFAETLTLFGAEVPMKLSDKTKKMTPALGIKDEGLLELLDHPEPLVRELVMARMGLKSSIEESRCIAMQWQAEFAQFPVPYKISGARTHRLGGGEGADGEDGPERAMQRGKVNMQNLPSGRIKGQSKALRESVEAPEGYLLVSADSSQIEVRTIDYMAGDSYGIEEHRRGVCPYSSLAVQLYGEGTPDQIKRDAKAGMEPWAQRRQMSKSARLSLQFGSGAEGFRLYCKANGVTITTEDAEFYKTGFRRSKRTLVNFWDQCGRVLQAMHRGESGYFGGLDGRLFFFDGARHVMGEHIPGILLPDGVWTSYPQLRLVEGRYGPTFVTTEMVGRKPNTLYWHGAKVAQNLTQALAFAVMKYYATKITERIVLNSHDEHVLCVKAEDAPRVAGELEALMKTAPPWVPGLPLDCEVHVGPNYGVLK